MSATAHHSAKSRYFDKPCSALLACISRFSHCFSDIRLAAFLTLGCGYLVASLLLRIVLFVLFGLPGGSPGILLLPVLGVGAINDLIALCYLLAPLSLYLFLLPARFHQSRSGRAVLATIIWITFYATLYLAVLEYYYFKEFNSRFNLVAVDYLIYPHEVFGNIIESYHVVSIATIIAIYVSAMLVLFLKLQKEAESRFPRKVPPRILWLAGHAVLVAVFASFFSTHSFDFSKNRIITEIAADGISSFFEALHTNHLDYTTLYRTRDQDMLTGLLRTQLATDTSRTSPDRGNFNRKSGEIRTGLGKLNVVVIVEESFGCEQVDACGQGLDLSAALNASSSRFTPNLNKLANQGLFFNKAYATGTRTVRGLEAITSSFPPIPSESIIKRQGNDQMTTWGEVMGELGYHTSFLYGGFSQFDNMKAFYTGNGFAVSDRFDIENPRFANIWGVSDQDLFRHARSYFDERAASGTPFFSIIMTTSNHSPYTFPEGIDGVQPKGGSRSAGIRYADHALGEFFENSSTASWYKDTLFVVVADHGARVYGSERIPLQSYEIPLLIIAPGRLQPQEVASPISQIDIAPTVLGLLGLPYKAPFFGQNVFSESEDSRILLFNHNHDVALYENGTLAVLGLHNNLHTYKYRLGEEGLKEIAENQAVTDLAIAYYQIAFNLFTGRGTLQNIH